MKPKHTALLGIIGVVLYASAVVFSGLQIENYSTISQFISEAYAKGTPYGIYYRIFGYFPAGVLFILFGLGAASHLKKTNALKWGGIGFAFFYGFSTVMTSIFPCDFGCSTHLVGTSYGQLIHNIFSVLVYVFLPSCILLFGIGLSKINQKKRGKASIIVGVLAYLFVPLVLIQPDGPWTGLFQRIIEACILCWVCLLAHYFMHLKTSK